MPLVRNISVLLGLLLSVASSYGFYDASVETHSTVTNVLGFGAVGDGVVDDTGAFQNAIDFITAQSGGGDLMIPPGTFAIDNVKLKSNVHMRVDPATVLVPYDPTLSNKVNMITVGKKDTVAVENVSITCSETNERFVVEMPLDHGPGLRFVVFNYAHNFRISGVDIKAHRKSYSGIIFGPSGEDPAIHGWPQQGTIENASITNAPWGYGLIQTHAASHVLFQNLHADGGVTVRLESGSGGSLGTVDDIDIKNVSAANGKTAVNLQPHIRHNGIIRIEGVRATNCAFAVELNGGFVSSKDPTNSVPGTFASGSYVKDVTAVFGMTALHRYADHKHLPDELVPYIQYDADLDGVDLAPSVCAVFDVANYKVEFEDIKAIGFDYLPPIYKGVQASGANYPQYPMGISEDVFVNTNYLENLDGTFWSAHTNVNAGGTNWISGSAGHGILDLQTAPPGLHAINANSGFELQSGSYLIMGSDFRYHYAGGGKLTSNINEEAFGFIISDNANCSSGNNASCVLGNRGNGLGLINPLEGFMPHAHLGVDLNAGGWSDWFRMEWIIERGPANYQGTARLLSASGVLLHEGSPVDLGIPNGTKIYSGYTTGSSLLTGPVSGFSGLLQVQMDHFKVEKAAGTPPPVASQPTEVALVHWGESGGDTNIVSSKQPFQSSVKTYVDGLEANPVVGTNYYPDAENRSPRFNHVGTATNTKNIENDDVEGDYILSNKNRAHYESMVVWESLLTNGASLQRLEIETRVENADLGSEFRWVVAKGTNAWYASDPVATTNTFASYSVEDAGTLNWHVFNPYQLIDDISFTNEISVIDMAGITAIGFWSESDDDVDSVHKKHETRFFKATGRMGGVDSGLPWESFAIEHLLSGSKTADDDGDGLVDWGEYVFGGNPTNSADRGVQPHLDAAGGTYGFSLVGDDRLVANVFTNSDLSSPAWGVFTNIIVTATNGLLQSYTNYLDMLDSQLFIKLDVE